MEDRANKKRKIITTAQLYCSEVYWDVNNCSDESDDTETEDEILMTITVNKYYKSKPVRILNYVETTVASYTATQFQQNFRITIEAYQLLLTTVGPQLQRQGTVGRQTINVEKQLLSVLWLLATPDSYRSVGERFDLGKSSLSVCFMRVIKILCGLAPRIISWPRGQRLQQVKANFARMWGIPDIIGVVDGTYMEMKAPQIDPESYITRKCDYAITMQAICDDKLNFTDVFVGYPGSVSDVRIFRNSPIYQRIRANTDNYFPDNEYIIGDKAYPVFAWCMTPYINRGNLTAAQRNFNTKLSQCRQTIERSFALFFGRLRRFRFIDMNRMDVIPSAVLAATVVHNLCLQFADLQIENYIQEGIQAVHHNEQMEQDMMNLQADGRNRRDRICQQLYQRQ